MKADNKNVDEFDGTSIVDAVVGKEDSTLFSRTSSSFLTSVKRVSFERTSMSQYLPLHGEWQTHFPPWQAPREGEYRLPQSP